MLEAVKSIVSLPLPLPSILLSALILASLMSCSNFSVSNNSLPLARNASYDPIFCSFVLVTLSGGLTFLLPKGNIDDE